MKQTNRFLIYGATGFTGKLTAWTAKERGLKPILAARNEAKLRAIAQPLDFEYRVFNLTEPAAIHAALREVDAVLHIAGPFSATSKPIADACLRTGTHYLDITREIDVFEALAARDAEAKRAGIMLLPGVGFDVVPSDCLALHLKQKLPDATDLKIYIGGLNALSHGTAKSMVEGVPLGLRVRRNGRITEPSPRPKQTTCDFGDGPTSATVIPWGDVSTAYYSTKIPNIEVRMATTPPLRFAANLPGFARRIMGTSDGTFQRQLAPCNLEPLHEIGGASKHHAPAVLDQCETERCRQMALAAARWTKEQDVGALAQPRVAGRERHHLGL
jgi:short subunit dehydrogenase-like uncharacterized protein